METLPTEVLVKILTETTICRARGGLLRLICCKIIQANTHLDERKRMRVFSTNHNPRMKMFGKDKSSTGSPPHYDSIDNLTDMEMEQLRELILMWDMIDVNTRHDDHYGTPDPKHGKAGMAELQTMQVSPSLKTIHKKILRLASEHLQYASRRINIRERRLQGHKIGK